MTSEVKTTDAPTRYLYQYIGEAEPRVSRRYDDPTDLTYAQLRFIKKHIHELEFCRLLHEAD